MEIPVIAQLVPAVRDLFDKFGVVVRPAAADKEGGAHAVLLQHVHYAAEELAAPIHVEHQRDAAALPVPVIVHPVRKRRGGNARRQEADGGDRQHQQRQADVGDNSEFCPSLHSVPLCANTLQESRTFRCILFAQRGKYASEAARPFAPRLRPPYSEKGAAAYFTVTSPRRLFYGGGAPPLTLR